MYAFRSVIAAFALAFFFAAQVYVRPELNYAFDFMAHAHSRRNPP